MSGLDAISEQFEGPLIVLDIGAAGIFKDLRSIASKCEIHLLEPRDHVVQTSDGAYGKVVRHNTALAGEAGERTLFVTENGYSSSMLRPNKAIVDRWDAEDIFRIAKEVKLQCVTLDAFVRQAAISRIDYLKIDTQGTELEIFRGGAGILDHTSIVRTEVEFAELYENQPLFDDVASYLNSRGFRFVDFYDGEKFGGPDRPKRIWSDAIFARRGLTGDPLLKAAAVLIELGYWTDAIWMMQDGGFSEEKIDLMNLPQDTSRGAYPRTIKNLARFLLGRLNR
jgi:FkbM family methyltransferase